MAAQALILDFGGVISKTLFETHRDSERALGLSFGTLDWMGPFDPASDSMWRSMQAGEISERDYWYARAYETGKLVGEDWDTLPKFLRRVRGDDPAHAIRPEALAAIGTAKKMGHRLAILSNELDLFYGPEFRDKLPFLKDFDLIIDATHTKILKPDHRAYNSVIDCLSLAAENCVFVDDQLRNIEGAASCGLRVVHFDVKQPADSFARAFERLSERNHKEITR